MSTSARVIPQMSERPSLADDEIDLRQVFGRLWMERWWIVAAVVLSTGAFAAYAFLSPRIYRAATVMVSASNDRSGLSESLSGALGSLGGLASVAGINLNSSGSETQEVLAVLRSRQFTESFIMDKNLMPELFPKAWDAQAGKWKAGVRQPTPARAYKYFDENIRSVLEDKKTGLITLTIEWKDREEAAAWDNELVQRLNAEMRNRAIEKANASLGFLRKEIESTSMVETRDAINRLIEAQIKQRMLANVTQEYAFRIVDRALAPDVNDPVRPKKILLLVAGPLIGLVLGAAGVLAVDWLLRATGRRLST